MPQNIIILKIIDVPVVFVAGRCNNIKLHVNNYKINSIKDI